MLAIQSNWELTRRPITGEIRKIILYFDRCETLHGIRFFDTAGNCIYESAYKIGLNHKQHEIILNEGERIVGFVSRE